MKSFTATALSTLVLASTASASPTHMAERGLIGQLLCLPYSILVGSPDAVQYCSSLLARTVTTTKTATNFLTQTYAVTVPATGVVTRTFAAPTPTVTQSLTYSSCGLVGYDNTNIWAYDVDSTGDKDGFAACKAWCGKDSKCKGFAFGQGSCLLYDVTFVVGKNFKLNPASPYAFSDRDCPAAAAAAGPPSSYGKEKRGLPVPGAFIGLVGAAQSNACSCLVQVPATVTCEVVKTITSTASVAATITAVVGTKVISVFTTPAPVTVTIAAKVGA